MLRTYLRDASEAIAALIFVYSKYFCLLVVATPGVTAILRFGEIEAARLYECVLGVTRSHCSFLMRLTPKQQLSHVIFIRDKSRV